MNRKAGSRCFGRVAEKRQLSYFNNNEEKHSFRDPAPPPLNSFTSSSASTEYLSLNPSPPRFSGVKYRSAATRGDVAAMSEERESQDSLLLDSLAHAQQKLQVPRGDGYHL